MKRPNSASSAETTSVVDETKRSSAIYDLFARPRHNALRVGEACCFYGRGEPVEIAADEVQGLRVERGLFWRKLMVLAGEKGDVILPGLSARRLSDAARSVHDRYLRSKVEATLVELATLLDATSYPRNSLVRAFLARSLPVRPGDLAELEEVLDASSFADLEKVAELSHWNIDTPSAAVESAKQRYVERELRDWGGFFDQIEKHPLTQMQREAIVHDEDAVLVSAGAGTGKTSTIVAKVLYLLKRGIARPDQILVLAFNRKARDEIDKRLEELAKESGIDSAGVEVKTFHALGRKILGTSQGEMPALVEEAGDEKRTIQRLDRIIHALMKESSEFASAIVEWFAFHASPPPVEEGDEAVNSMADYNRYLREVERRALADHFVRSHEELLIANWLWLNSIENEYEAKYEHRTSSPTRGDYKPDFSLYRTDEYGDRKRIYLEHFGVDKQGRTAPHIDSVKYRESMRWKREIHETKGTTLIETYSWMRRDGVLTKELDGLVRAAGFKPRARPTEEVFARLNELNRISPFVKELVTRILGLAKERGLRGSELDGRVKSLVDEGAHRRAMAFLKVFAPIAERYEDENDERREIDFADMILRACESAEEGRWDDPWRFILVDEFQDISHGRARLVKALRSLDPACRLFCVGDDWQAINGFAGGAVELMTDFEQHFGFVKIVALDRTFRYGKEIVQISSSFVQRDPALMRKSLKGNEDRTRSLVEVQFVKGDDRFASLVQLLTEIENRAAEDDDRDVLVLGRYRHSLPERRMRDRITRDFPSLEIDWRTVHAAKGLEATEVIVLDVSASLLGFPCARADDPLLDLVRDRPAAISFAEERRLFYVALTRSRERVTLLTPLENPSRFVQELRIGGEEMPHDHGAHGGRRPCIDCDDGRLEKKLSRNGNTYYRCSNHPACAYMVWPCKSCGTQIPDRTGLPPWVCGCGAKERLCPSCRVGLLVKRNGRYGDFFGCTNYQGESGCKYTEKC